MYLVYDHIWYVVYVLVGGWMSEWVGRWIGGWIQVYS